MSAPSPDWYPLPDAPKPVPPYRGSFTAGLWPPGTPAWNVVTGAVTQGLASGSVDVPSGTDAKNVTLENYLARGLDIVAGATSFTVPALTARNYPIDIEFEQQLENFTWRLTPNTGDALGTTNYPQLTGLPVDGRTIRYTLNDTLYTELDLTERGIPKPVLLWEQRTSFPAGNNALTPILIRDKLFVAAGNKSREYTCVGLQVDYQNFAGNAQFFVVYDTTDQGALATNTGLGGFRVAMPWLYSGSGSVYFDTPGIVGFAPGIDWATYNLGASAIISVTAWVVYDI